MKIGKIISIWMLLYFLSEVGNAYSADNKTVSKPKHTAVIVGKDATFSCYFGNHKTQWRYTPVGSTKALPITMDGLDVTPHFHPYITLSADRQNNSILIINETQLEHAGEYHAHAVPELGGIQGAQLIILVSEPNCTIFETSTERHRFNQTAEMACTVEYRGNWKPSMKWEVYSEGDPIGNASDLNVTKHNDLFITNESVTSRMQIQITSNNARLRGIYFTCTTYFSKEGLSNSENETKNSPNYTYIWKSPTIQFDVADQPSSFGTHAMVIGISIAALSIVAIIVFAICCVCKRKRNLFANGRTKQRRIRPDIPTDPGTTTLQPEIIPIYAETVSGRGYFGEIRHDPSTSVDESLVAYAETRSTESIPFNMKDTEPNPSNKQANELGNCRNSPRPRAKGAKPVYSEVKKPERGKKKMQLCEDAGGSFENYSCATSLRPPSDVDRTSPDITQHEKPNVGQDGIVYETTYSKGVGPSVGVHGVHCHGDAYYSNVDHTLRIPPPPPQTFPH